MARSKKARPAWYVAWTAFGIFVVVSALVVLRGQDTLLKWIIRDLALLGYIAIFLTIVSSYYKRQVMRLFGRSFLNAHHILSVTGGVFLTLHPLGVAWDAMALSVLVPVFVPVSDMLKYGGRIAWYVFAAGALTALWRKTIGKRWRTIHGFNYLAFAFGTIHANLVGTDFQNLPVRVVSIAMFIVVAILFIRQRIEAWRQRAKIEGRKGDPRDV
jgi:DMSO/TMAO reductase YedYZ heme-binding membrane subunit